MKQQPTSSRQFSRKFSLARLLALGAGVSVASLLQVARGADKGWVGTTNSDWNTASNWTDGALPANGDSIYIQNTNGPATISSDSLFSPSEIRIGDFFATGRLDQTAGSLTTSATLIVARNNNGVGTYNLANTAASGGTLTGYGTGSGSASIGGNLNVAAWQGATGTVNVNTSGTLAVSNDISVGGENNSTGTFNLDSGTLTGNGQMRLGDDNFGGGGGTGIYNQSGGNATIAGLIIAGDDTSTHGTINLSGGTLTGNSEVWIGATGTGTANQTGGTLNANSYLILGRAGSAIANYSLSGGTLNAAVNGGLVSIASVRGSTATMDVSGTGTLHSSHQIFVGEGWTGSGTATGTLNVSGGGLVQVDDVFDGLRLGANAGADGTVNLNGGTILTPVVTQGGGTGTFNFNGGTLKARQDNAGFMQGLTVANVRGGGAVIDTNGYNVTVAQPLVHSTLAGDAATNGGLTKLGLGALTLSGANTYTGTTAVNAGALLVNGSTAGGAVTVNNTGSFLGGTGTVGGAVTVGAGSLLKGGADATGQTLTLATGLTLSGGSILEIILGATGAHSTIAFAPGGFNGFNANQAFTFDNLQTGAYDNIFTGVAADINTTGWTVTNGSGYTFSFLDDGTNIDLNVSIAAVPEPTTVYGGLLMVALVGYCGRRRLSSLARALHGQ